MRNLPSTGIGHHPAAPRRPGPQRNLGERGTNLVRVQPPNQPAQPAVPPQGPAPAVAKPRNRRLRLFLAMGAGILALLCLGGVGVFVSLYDEATKIERSEPDAVVDNFLGAYLVNRNDEEADLYMCRSGGDFSQISAYRSDIADREKSYSVGIRVTWTGLTVSTQGERGTVSTDLTRTTTNQSGRDSQSWEFTIVDDDGWRVCGARPLT
jgi:hypothetical protein